MKKCVLFIGFMLIFTGCGPSRADYEALLSQNNELQANYNQLELDYQEILEENGVLEQHLNEIVLQPAKLETEIHEHLAQNDHENAYKKAAVLTKKFSQTTEAVRVKPIFEKLHQQQTKGQQQVMASIKIQKGADGKSRWYFHKDLLKIYESTVLFAYIIENSNQTTLVLRAQQFAPRGSSLKKVELILNNSVLSFNSKSTNKPFGDSVLLYIDAPLNNMQIVSDIAKSSNSIINFYGSNSISDLITPKEREMLAAVIKAYKVLTKTTK